MSPWIMSPWIMSPWIMSPWSTIISDSSIGSWAIRLEAGLARTFAGRGVPDNRAGTLESALGLGRVPELWTRYLRKS